MWAYLHAVGHNWAASLSFLNNTDPAKLALPGGVPASINLIASLLTGSIPLLLIIGVGFILWALMGTPLSTLQATRYMLAWSLDRVVPKQLGSVNDQFHTPIKAILICAVTGEIALFALVQIPEASLLGALLAQIAAFIVVSIAGIVFPYRLKAVWESGGGRRIAGVPGGDAGRYRRGDRARRPDDHVHLQPVGQRRVRGDPQALARVHDRRDRDRRDLVRRSVAGKQEQGRQPRAHLPARSRRSEAGRGRRNSDQPAGMAEGLSWSSAT